MVDDEDDGAKLSTGGRFFMLFTLLNLFEDLFLKRKLKLRKQAQIN